MRQTDGYYMLLMGYARSPFRDFERYIRMVVGLDEGDIQLILKQYFSNFVICKRTPGIYTSTDISKAVYTVGVHEGTLKTENNDITMKTKPTVTRFGEIFGTIGFHEKTFLKHY